LRYSEVEKTNTGGQRLAPDDTLYGSPGDADFGQYGFGISPYTEIGLPISFQEAGITTSPWNEPTQKETWEAITGTLKLNYFVNEDMSVYIGYDRGFKAGGLNTPKNPNSGDPIPATGYVVADPFDEEYADNVEAGFKSFLFDRRLRINGSMFYQMYTDYQVEIQEEGAIGLNVVNAAKAVIRGAEFDMQWLVTENLTLDGTLSYVDARWDEYTTANCTRPQFARVACDNETNTQDLTDKRINDTSPWTANINGTWDDTLDNGMGWYVRGELAFRDDVLFSPDLDPDLKQGSYTVFNASFGISSEDETIQAILWGKNLTAKEYLTNMEGNRDSSNVDFNALATEGIRVSAGAERSYGVTLKYNF
jgi:iron complex outermembrane receptor protein